MFFRRSRCSTTFLEGVINRISSKSALQRQSLTRKIFKLSRRESRADFFATNAIINIKIKDSAVLAISIVFRERFSFVDKQLKRRTRACPDWTSNSLSFIDFAFAAFEHETFKIRSQEIRKVEVSATGAQNITVSFLRTFSTRTASLPFALWDCF